MNTHKLKSTPPAGGQRGMALIMALVILLILTILGVTAMTTSSLEEKMSGNIQEQTKAFEAAESGIAAVLLDPNAYTLSGVPYAPSAYQYGPGKATVTVTFRRFSEASRATGAIFSKNDFQDAHFEIRSEGTTVTNAKSVNLTGIRQIARKVSN